MCALVCAALAGGDRRGARRGRRVSGPRRRAAELKGGGRHRRHAIRELLTSIAGGLCVGSRRHGAEQVPAVRPLCPLGFARVVSVWIVVIVSCATFACTCRSDRREGVRGPSRAVRIRPPPPRSLRQSQWTVWDGKGLRIVQIRDVFPSRPCVLVWPIRTGLTPD
eukprot:4561975-Prymnesium_polylepis.1